MEEVAYKFRKISIFYIRESYVLHLVTIKLNGQTPVHITISPDRLWYFVKIV